MKILLAVATGAIGRRLLPRLVAAGHTVVAMTRSPASARQLEAARVHAIVVDAFDREAVLNAVRREQPEAVIHQLTDLAGRDFEANARLRIEGTRNLVDAAREAGIRRMVAQSIAWMYAAGAGPATEEEPLDLAAEGARGRTVEGVAALERAAGELPESVILRYGTLYGQGTWYGRGGLVEKQLYRGELKAGGGLVSSIHVDDAAEAACAALVWPPGPVNVVDDEPAPMSAWLTAFARALSAPLPTVVADGAAYERGAANARARLLGWVPRYPSWRQGFVLGLG